jgi:ATPase subunit of ABC transporter with duplicated ATPase domains
VSTQEIATTVSAILDETGRAVSRMQDLSTNMSGSVGMARQAGDSLETIDQRAQQTVEVVHGIADSTREQSAASQEIARLVENIAQAAEGSNSRAVRNSERAQKSAAAGCRAAYPVGALYHLSERQAVKLPSSQRGALWGAVFIATDALPQTLRCLPCLRPCAASRSCRFSARSGERVALIGRNGTGNPRCSPPWLPAPGGGGWMMAKSGRSRAFVSAMCRRSRPSTRR